MGTRFLSPAPKKVGRFHYKKGVSRAQSHLLRNAFGVVVLTGLIGLGVKTQVMPLFVASGLSHQSVEAHESQKDKAQPKDTSLPIATDLPKQDAGLEKSINGVIATFPKDQKWSVFVRDLETNRSATINGDDSFESASLYKLFLLAPLESKTPADKWNYYRLGGTNVKDCVDAMLRVSDNDCAKSVAYMANWNYVDQFNSSMGYKNTTVNGTPRTTANEVGDLLVNLKRGKLLSDKARRIVFDALYAQKFTEGLPSGCANCRTANKTGQVGQVTHDAGIVTHGKRSYVIVVMSQGGNFGQIAQVTKVVEEELNP